MTLSKIDTVGITQGFLIFLAFWLAKMPLIFIFDHPYWAVKIFLGLLLIISTFASAILLLFMKKYSVAIYQILIMLTLLPASLINGNEFGIYKVFSLVLFLNLVVFTYFIRPSFFDVKAILTTMAAAFAIYGVLSIAAMSLIGDGLSQRGIIGFNGPIVFGQYMIFSFTIFLLYEKKVRALFMFAMALISQSKGPLLVGLISFGLASKNKIKLIFISLPILLVGLFFFTQELRAFQWIFYLLEHGALPNGGSFSARIDLYNKGYMAMFGDSLGLGGWSSISEYKYPHNIFIEILTELPLMLSIPFLVTNIVAFFSIKDSVFRILFIIFLFMAQLSGSIIDNRGIFLIIILFLLAKKSRRRNAE
jgi:hypothetical protein